jgi:hypothetical protein
MDEFFNFFFLGIGFLFSLDLFYRYGSVRKNRLIREIIEKKISLFKNEK